MSSILQKCFFFHHIINKAKRAFKNTKSNVGKVVEGKADISGYIDFFSDTNKEIAIKYKIKDSVFTNLFRDKKYLLQLYKVFHPEDTDVTQDSLTDITIHNILTDAVYNDLEKQLTEL